MPDQAAPAIAPRQGRPGLVGGQSPQFDPAEWLDLITAQVEAGTPLVRICEQAGYPSASQVQKWQRERPEWRESLACARDLGCEAVAADILTIVDNEDLDPASRRVRAESRFKLLACWSPRYRPDAAPAVNVNVAVAVLSEQEREELVAVRRAALAESAQTGPQALELPANTALPGTVQG